MSKGLKRIIGSVMLAVLAMVSVTVIDPCGGNEKDLPFIGQNKIIQNQPNKTV